MPRFVVLDHQLPADHPRRPHWDLMLEQGSALATWALDEPPADGRSIPARRLADHRLAYLDYEGPVAGNRGVVRRWDWGTYVVRSQSPRELVLQIRGQRGDAVLTLQHLADDFWQVQLEAAETS